jgi:hypothetical protein
VLFKSSKRKQYYALSEDCLIHNNSPPPVPVPSIPTVPFPFPPVITGNNNIIIANHGHTHNYHHHPIRRQLVPSRSEIILPFPFDILKSKPFCDEKTIKLKKMPFFRPMADVSCHFCSRVCLLY